MVFPIDPSLSKPIILTPHGPEYKKPIPIIPPKTVNKKQNKPAPNQSIKPEVRRDYGAGEIQNLIIKYSEQYGISSETPLCIAKHESGFNSNARNPNSTAKGVFQYLDGTWKATDEGRAGYSVLDAESNIRAAVKYMSSRKNAKPWTVHTKCPPIKIIN